MSGNLKVQAGTCAIILSGIGTVGRLIFVATRPGGMHPLQVVASLSTSQLAFGFISAILVLAGGVVGVLGAVKNDGRGMSIAAIALTVIVVILIFAAGVI
jgi:hypothetical protein